VPLAVIALSVPVVLVFLLAGAQKVLLRRAVTANMGRLGVSSALTRLIGILEIAGAVGIVVGIWLTSAAIAATTGLVLLLIGAVGYHARAGDYMRRGRRAEAVAPAILLVVTGLIGALRLALP
jgi:uncharacterized membrane protein YphA (DoxX/SURF4 family)